MNPDDERDRRARARAQARVERRRERQQGERHETGEEVVAGRRPGVGLKEVVVGDMERDEREPEPREPGLAAQRGAYARPRDGSRQWTGGGGMAHDVTPGEREKCMRPACRAAAPATSGSHPEPNPDFPSARVRGRHAAVDVQDVAGALAGAPLRGEVETASATSSGRMFTFSVVRVAVVLLELVRRGCRRRVRAPRARRSPRSRALRAPRRG